MWKKRISLAALAALLLLGPNAVRAEHRLVVVELFTSFGCSSCPAAESVVGLAAQRPGVLVLSHHVDYWDYLGWRDPFGSRAATRRQQAYARALKSAYVFTPQVHVDGRRSLVGSDGAALGDAVTAVHRDGATAVAVHLNWIGPRQLHVRVGPAKTKTVADVWLVEFDKRRALEVDGGENDGRNLVSHHVVRRIERLGAYDGRPLKLTVRVEGEEGKPRYGSAVLVQTLRMGPILGAAVSKRGDLVFDRSEFSRNSGVSSP
jgi:hypothetical protein